MSKFSNFCNFLGSCNSGGIHLVAFYFKLHMFLCSKNYESAGEILHQIKNEFLDEGKGLLRTICGHSGRYRFIVRLRYRSWSPDKGSSSCLPKEARIEYEKQEKSVAGNSSYWPSFPGNFKTNWIFGSFGNFLERFRNYIWVKEQWKIIWIYFMDLASFIFHLNFLKDFLIWWLATIPGERIYFRWFENVLSR